MFNRPGRNMDSPSWSNRKLSNGNQGVRFSANGQLTFPGQPSSILSGRRPANMLLSHYKPAAVMILPPLSAPGLPFRRYRPVPPSVSNTSDRNFHRNFFRQPVGIPTGPMYYPEKTSAVGATPRKAEAPELAIVEELRVYNEPPCCWAIFLVVGLLMVGVGITNVLVCFDNHSFCYLWTGASLLGFTIVCGIHKGEYWERKWKSVVVIGFGITTTALALASLYVVLVSFCHQSIEIVQFTPDFYISIQKYRFNYYNIAPILTLDSDWMYNIWAGFSLDALGILLLSTSLGVMTTTMFVIDRFFNSHYVINRMVDPFCEPCLFNPWSQTSLGQAMIVVGAVVGACQHGIESNTSWFITHAPVWAGISPMVSGIVAALALKYCGNLRRSLMWFGVLAEFQSLATSSVAVVFTSMLLSDNIKTLINGGAMIVTSWGRDMVIASSLLECLADMICIVNVFYSLSLLCRLLTCLFTKWHHLPVGAAGDEEVPAMDENRRVSGKKHNKKISGSGSHFEFTHMGPPGLARFYPHPMGGTRSFNIG